MRRRMLTSGLAMMALAGALGLSACATFGTDEAQALLDRPQVDGDVPDSDILDVENTADLGTFRFVGEDAETNLRFYLARSLSDSYCVFAYALDDSGAAGGCGPTGATVTGQLPEFRLIAGGPTPPAPEGFRAVGGGVFVRE
ncbi:hypothetical protein [Microcella putealis]|nr:hypothetical protein [Microcella putealis]